MPPPPDAIDPIAEARRRWVEHGWVDAAPGMAAITSLMRAQAIVSRRVEVALRPLGITFARYEVLMLLSFSRRGSLPMSLIGARLQVHQTSVTNAVDRLEAADYEKATEVLNRDVFSQPGLGPAGVEVLLGQLDDLRHEAGDY